MTLLAGADGYIGWWVLEQQIPKGNDSSQLTVRSARLSLFPFHRVSLCTHLFPDFLHLSSSTYVSSREYPPSCIRKHYERARRPAVHCPWYCERAWDYHELGPRPATSRPEDGDQRELIRQPGGQELRHGATGISRCWEQLPSGCERRCTARRSSASQARAAVLRVVVL